MDVLDCKLVLLFGLLYLYWDVLYDVNIFMEKISVLKKFFFYFIYLIVNIGFKEKGFKIFLYVIDVLCYLYLLWSKYRKIIRKGIFKFIFIYFVLCCFWYKII